MGVPLTLWCCFAVRMGPIGSIDENGNIGPLALIEGVHNNGMVSPRCVPLRCELCVLCTVHCTAAHTTGAPDLQNCELCYTNKGPFVMCSAKGCNIQFHALCGRTLGTYLQVEPNWAASQIRKVRVREVPGCVFKAVTLAVLAQVVGDDASVLPTQVTYCPAHTDTFARAAAAAAVRQPYVPG